MNHRFSTGHVIAVALSLSKTKIITKYLQYIHYSETCILRPTWWDNTCHIGLLCRNIDLYVYIFLPLIKHTCYIRPLWWVCGVVLKHSFHCTPKFLLSACGVLTFYSEIAWKIIVLVRNLCRTFFTSMFDQCFKCIRSW